jgi:hypothetical protein
MTHKHEGFTVGPTPRTDAHLEIFDASGRLEGQVWKIAVAAWFARQLERENIDLLRRCDEGYELAKEVWAHASMCPHPLVEMAERIIRQVHSIEKEDS